MGEETTKKRKQLSSYTILLGLLVVLAVVSVLIGLIPGSGVEGAKLSNLLMAPVGGWNDAISVCIFVTVLGGFIGVMNATGALDAGIAALVQKLNGKELALIPIIMVIFSFGGTSFGMGEETVPLYFLLAATFVSAGFDSMVGAAVVLFGAGCGVLGSTINPFATGIAADSLMAIGIEVDQGIVIALGVILWVLALLIAIVYTMRYAKKVKADRGSTILSLQEREEMDVAFGSEAKAAAQAVSMTGPQKAALIVFAGTFLTMAMGVIPWENFGVTFFLSWSGFLTGTPMGQWWFDECTTVFVIGSLLIILFDRLSEEEAVDAFVFGAGDMMGVVLVIALARAITVLMNATGLDVWILTNAANLLRGMSAGIFAPLSYLIYCGLSFLIPSSSGMAAVSMPIMGPLASELGFSPEVMVQIFSSANGLINLFTPTCGFIMGGLAIAKINYGTWLKWARAPIALMALVSVVVLTAAMFVL